VRPPNLSLAEILVVDEHMAQRRGHGSVEHGIHRDVERRLRVHENLHVGVADGERRRDVNTVGHEAGAALLLCVTLVAGGDLRAPVKRPVAQDLRDFVPAILAVEATHDPRNEAVREKGAHSLRGRQITHTTQGTRAYVKKTE
jgi:hypothetical protein